MTQPDTIHILIADDEPLARQGLVDMLASKPNVNIIAQAENGVEAVYAIQKLSPDLVFLDIQMPGKTGIEVIQEIGPESMPEVIFVTAYDQYALKAFEFAAVDYLLKPFEEGRFNEAFERAREKLSLRELSVIRNQLTTLLHLINSPDEPSPTSQYLKRIPIEGRGQVNVVSVQEIDYITASGPYVEIHIGQQQYLIRERMHILEDRLHPESFFRIHRSTIVQLDRIDSILLKAGGDYGVLLKNGTKLKLGRSRRAELEQRLGLDALGS